MTTSEQWKKLMGEHEIAYLRGDLATSSPQSYTLDERRQIYEQMEASAADIDAALRADFWSMPAEARSRMLDLLELPAARPGSGGKSCWVLSDEKRLDWLQERCRSYVTGGV